MTSIETAVEPLWIAVGLTASILLFFWLSMKSRVESRLLKTVILLLRLTLCVLIWALIAQPRAVTRNTQPLPPTVNIAIDTSDSMTLVDTGGPNSDPWRPQSTVTPLDEAVALATAIRIRLQLMSLHPATDEDEHDAAIRETSALISRTIRAIHRHGNDTGTQRLTTNPVAALEHAAEALAGIHHDNAQAAIATAQARINDTVTELHRLSAILHQNPGHGNADTPRLDLVSQWLHESREMIKDLRRDGVLNIHRFADGLNPHLPGQTLDTPSTSTGSTRITENLNRMAAISNSNGNMLNILITDGVEFPGDTDTELSADIRNNPLIVLPIGDTDTSPDIRIESVVSPARVRVGDRFVARASIASSNTGPVDVNVTLSADGQTLDTRTISLTASGGTEVAELEWIPEQTGHIEMTVEVDSVNNEKLLHNNVHQLETTSLIDHYRVLVCDSLPRWETRYLRNLFRRDPDIESIGVLFNPRHSYPGNPEPNIPSLPLLLEAWQEFQLVIIGDVTPEQLTPQHQQLLVQYVERGGNLMIIAGDNWMPRSYDNSPISKLLPVTTTSRSDIDGTFVIKPPGNATTSPLVKIDQGNSSATWSKLFTSNPCYRISAWSKAKPSAHRLLSATDAITGNQHDFLCYQRYGRGKVVFSAAPCFYHLRHAHGDRYHLRFWGALIRGICADEFGFSGNLVRTRLDKQLWSTGSEVKGRVRVRDEQETPVTDAVFHAVLSNGNREIARVQAQQDSARNGDYIIKFPGLPAGDYRISYEGGMVGDLWDIETSARNSTPECRFRISRSKSSGEQSYASTPPPFWNEVRQLPLGALIHPRMLSAVIDAIDLQPRHLTTVRSRSLWDRWLLLLVIIAVSSIEWLLRRVNGLC